MKKWLTSGLALVCVLCLAGCGSSSRSYSDNGTGFEISNSKSAAPGMAIMQSYSTDSSDYITGGDYSSTSITGDMVDYSYDFRAGGNTKKSKAEMLEDYEHIQDFVNEKGGYIDSVYNNYENYDSDDYDYYRGYSNKYISRGTLQFNIEIDNEYVLDVLAELEQFCVDNKFTVTTYTQQIQNYQNCRVVDEYSDEVYYGETITRDELNRRLAYADISVNIGYYNPRAKIVVFFKSLIQHIEDFFEDFGEIVQVLILILIILLVVFAEIIWFYKMFRKMMYKHRQKHPEYYAPKGVYIISQQEIAPTTVEEKKES